MFDDAMIEALIHIHQTLPRKGPGCDAVSRGIMERLAPRLPAAPQMADMGCGNAHTAFLMHRVLGGAVTAVDFAPPFIDEARARLKETPGAAIELVVGDMCASGIPAASLDLMWSEGAAYAVGLPNALSAWRDLLKDQGLLVFSECCWRTPEPGPEARALWDRGYPEMGSIGATIDLAERSGYRLLAAEALESEHWWTSYFDPLRQRLDRREPSVAPDSVMAQVIREAREEQEVFRRASDEYGYVFFVLGKRP